MPPVTADQAIATVFQSAPGREAGRCQGALTPVIAVMSFNPRPAVRPGDARRVRVPARLPHSFNPRPAVRPGDASSILAIQPAMKVSIRARP